MNLEDIREHWQNWALSFGKDLRATTKGRTAKMIEIAAIGQVIDLARANLKRPLRVLEVGCGNGFNCSWIAQTYADCSVLGIDYIPEMIEAALTRRKEEGIDPARLAYQVGNALELGNTTDKFDVVFTDRCLINLNSWDLQSKAICGMIALTAPGGYLAMIENSAEARASQDQLRQAVGLPLRPIDKFNTFIADGQIETLAKSAGLEIVASHNVSSLHDLLLYVLLPMTNGGIVDYEHPLIEAAARLNIELIAKAGQDLGPIGQNRLVICRKAGKP